MRLFTARLPVWDRDHSHRTIITASKILIAFLLAVADNGLVSHPCDRHLERTRPMEPLAPKPSGLGSLAKSARGKHLTTARRVLLGVGILTILVNGALVVFARQFIGAQIHQEFRQEQAAIPNQAQMRELEDEYLLGFYVVQGAMIVMGAVFVAFGLMIKSYPVAITISALVIFVGMMAILAVLNPATLVQGWLIKIIFLVALVKALQAALAAQKEEVAAEAGPANA
jgi:hypothetical protein